VIEVKMTFPNQEALADFFAARKAAQLSEQSNAQAPAPAPTSGKSKKAADTELGATQAAAPATQPSASPSPSTPAVVDYTKTGLPEKIAAAAAKDRTATVALLTKFGVKKGPELKPEQFAEFGVEVDKLLAAEGALA
jgi:hypothetical protein